ncbi:MAG TPA: GGDEF domain-containing protein [Chloroflexota bacterium]|nr:GGDEF domain-containing protein [Chloroflexota bacterium]
MSARSVPISVAPLQSRRDTAQEDAAIDTVVAMLRTLGRLPFGGGEGDSAEIRRLFELWATHLAIGGPHPDSRPTDDRDVPPVLPKERDWPGARRFVQTRREHECEQVAKTVGQSHELIWDLTDKLSKSILDTRERDRELMEQLDRLKAAIASGSMANVEQAVKGATTMLTGAIKEREEKLQVQLEELGTRVAELSEQLQEVKVESRLDGLTRVANRADFDRAVKRWHHVGSAFGRPTCLIFVDVDHLKQINDRYGHRGGDAALKVFADGLVRCFPRRSDFVGRYGGDEFVVLLAETPGGQALRLAERFCQHIRGAVAEHDGATIALTASIGLAQLETDESIESWIERADQAVYGAKREGRNRVAFARPRDPVPGTPPVAPPAMPPTENASGREAAG